MPNCKLTGEIYFSEVLTKQELVDVSFFITQKSIDHRIGVNLYSNLTPYGLMRYPLREYAKEGFIPYEILDNPMTNECFEMFFNIMYPDKCHNVLNLSNTGVMRVQRFYESVLMDDRISYMTIYIEDVHGIPKKIYEYEIHAKEFCSAIEQTPNDENRLDLPAVRLKIKR